MAASDSMTPNGKTSFNWLRSDIDRLDKEKLDRDIFVSEIQTVKRDLDERKKSSATNRKLAEEAFNKEHKCMQEKQIEHMYKTISKIWKVLDSWRNIKIGVVVSIIVIVSATVLNYATLFTSVENNSKAVIENKNNQNEIKKEILSDVNSIKNKISQDKIEQRVTQQKRDKERDRKLKELMKEAIHEARANIKPTNRRTGH